MHNWSSIGALRSTLKHISKRYNEPLEFIGTVKLHGTNAGIRFHNNEFSTQSRTSILNPLKDNYNFNGWFDCNIRPNTNLMSQLTNLCNEFKQNEEDVITIFGEWCGPGIQKNVGISKIEIRGFFIFGLKVNEVNYPITSAVNIDCPDVYNILDFPSFNITIDNQRLGNALEVITNLTYQVEDECPVAKQLGIPSGIGEGIVWSCVNYPHDSRLMFKSKGEKHAGKSERSEKVIVSIDPVKMTLITDVVEYVLPIGRLQQGMEHVPELDIKHMGTYLRWISNDIIKEELDTLSENNLTWKEIAKQATDKAKNFFINQTNK